MPNFVADGKKQVEAGFSPSQKTKDAMARVATLYKDIGQTWGAGMLSTGPGNRAFRSTDPITGIIKTVVQIDLTGLAAKGDVAEDVIGLEAGGAAYIYQNVVADNGIIFQYTVSCIELPTGTNTTTDIDLTFNSAADKIYDNPLGTVTHDLDTLVAGETFTSAAASPITANHYLYLVEGSNSHSGGTYTGGQYVFTFYGYPVR